MDTENHRDRTVRRIVLPSGRTIEVLRFSEPAERADDRAADREQAAGRPASSEHPPRAATKSPRRPDVCPSCESSLVYPTDWNGAGHKLWRVELRCPNCERTERAVLDLEVAERFDEELERGAETLTSDLARLTEANMLEDLERFSAALRVDAILPADF